MFMFMSVAGGYGMFPDQNAKYVLAAISAIIDMLAIGFMFAMCAAHRDRKGVDAGLYGVAWLGLSVFAIFTAQSWLQHEFFVTWYPIEVQQGIMAADQAQLGNAQTATLSTDRAIRQAGKAAAKDAKTAISTDSKAVAAAPVKPWIKGNEWVLPTVLLIISHMAWRAAMASGKEELPPEVAAWMNAREIPANIVPPTPPKGKAAARQIAPALAAARQIAVENLSNTNVVEFPARKRHRPTAAEITAMLATVNETTGRRYNREQVAEHYGWSVRTIGNILQKAREQQARDEAARQAAA